MNILGIDIGGTKIAGALVTDTGNVLRRMDIPTPAMEGGPRVLEAALTLARTLRAGETISAVGIGAGGQIDPASGVVLSATLLLPGWAGTEISKSFSDALRVPSFADNDVNALAAGEYRFGAARGLSNVIFLAIGTGLGGALLLDGHLYHGAHGSAGEFGQMLFNAEPEGRRDAAGSRGTWEAYVSGPGLAQTYRALAGENARRLDGREIADNARRDPSGIAARAIAQTGTYLGLGLVSLANALDPEMIVIGGGLAEIGDLLLDPARQTLRERALPGPAQCPLVLASLGADASVIGAASIALDRL